MKKKLALLVLTICTVIACAIGFVACNITVPVDFELQFIVDGEVYATIDTAGEETISLPANPKKDGYEFDGWFWDENTWERPFTENSLLNEKLTSDMRIYGKWKHTSGELQEYTITFVADGETVGTATYTVEDKEIEEPAVPAKMGYSGEWEEYTLTTGSITVNAVYTPIEYTITFVADGETVGTATYTVEDKEIEEPAVPAKMGYLGEWEEYTLTTGSITVNAVYTPIKYYITYENTKGAENDNRIEYTIESETFSLSDLSIDGYIFKGWFSSEVKITQIEKGNTGDITLTATWETETYTLQFIIGEGRYEGEGNITTYNIETSIVFISPVSTREEYVFSGWYTEPEGGVKVMQIIKGTFGDKIYYAQYTPKKYSIEYVLYGGKNDDSNPSVYTIESKTIVLADATREGYIFDGWYKELSFKNQITSIEEGSVGDITLYAKWTAATTVNLYLHDSLYATYTLKQGETQTLPTPTVSGQYFFGWYTTQGTKVTSVTGQSSSTTYTYYGVTYSSSSATPIFTAAQLKDIGTTGLYFLAFDINASTINWEPIGTKAEPFRGTFDGNHFKIIGLKAQLSASSGRDYVGMFGYNSGTIKI